MQTLPNGATITRTFSVRSARDSRGRIYSETNLTSPIGFVHYTVFDPATCTEINWDNRTKIAVVTRIATPKSGQGPGTNGARQPHSVDAPPRVTREALGFRTIAGLEATGTRTTTIVAKGEVGNDGAFTIVGEKWISTQYHIPLLAIIEDPRSGKRTDEVTEFQPGEPNPVLFKIPEGYTVRETTAGPP